MTSKGLKVVCEKEIITVHAGKHQIHFTTVLRHGDGLVLTTDFTPNNNNTANLVQNKEMLYQDFHEQIGHPHQATTLSTAKHYVIKLKPPTDIPCTECA